MGNSIRTLIVDDHPSFRLGLRTFFRSAPDLQVIGETGSGETAIQMARELLPDVILMDLGLPDINGLQAIDAINAAHPGIRILVLSNYSDEQKIIGAFQAGAFGYLSKTEPPERLTQAVRDAFAGKLTLSQQVEASILAHMRQGAPGAGLTHLLTCREMEIFILVVEGLEDAQIAERFCIREDTVGAYIRRIQAKLNLENYAQMVIYAINEGLVDSSRL